MKTAAQLRLADIKKRAKASKGTSSGADVEASKDPAEVVVPQDQRPQHRLGWIPFVGEKVDTIDWARKEIQVCTQLLEKGRAVIEGDGESGDQEVRAGVCRRVSADGESFMNGIRERAIRR